MTDCCKIDLGQVPHNKGVNIGVAAPQGGYYYAILFFAGMRIRRKFYTAIGEDLVIPGPFNEKYAYKAQIEKPDGELLEEDDCNNFVFQTYTSVEEECEGCGPCCEDEPYIYA